MKYVSCFLLRNELHRRMRILKGRIKAETEGALYDNKEYIDCAYRTVKEQMRGKYPAVAGIRIYEVARENINSPLCDGAVESALKSRTLTVTELYSYRPFLLCALLTELSACADDKRKCEQLINSMRFALETDFSRIADRVCKVERIFSQDAAYPMMDQATRSQYRQALVRLAKKKKIKETELAESIAKTCEKESEHIGKYLFGEKKHRLSFLYFVFIAMFAVLSCASLFPVLSYFCILVLPCAYELGKQIADYMGSRLVVPSPLFSLEIKKIPDAMRTLTVITALLSENSKELFDRIEDLYLSNRDENARYGILADLFESDTPTDALDDKAITYASGRIDALNKKYNGGFCLFVRQRRYSQSEEKYIGWERKRGAVMNLVGVLRGRECDMLDFYGDPDCKKNIKYVITLDSDTVMLPDTVKKLVGYMAHPMNTPVLNKSANSVISGYAIMQPRMETLLSGAKKTVFSDMISASGGIKPYQSAGYNSYQELFGEGIFCGKGIFDAEIFDTVLRDAFPENTVLSHDILEGARLRTALICDTVFYDTVPANAISYFKRAHRWIRGDVQALCFAKRRVKNAHGEKIQNPANALSRYKIIDNVRKDLLPIADVAVITASALINDKRTAALLLVCGISHLFVPFAVSLFNTLFSARISTVFRRFYSFVSIGAVKVFRNFIFDLSSVFYAFETATSALLKSVYRMAVSKKHTLQWTAFSVSDAKKSRLADYVLLGLPSALYGTFAAVFSNSVTVLAVGGIILLYPVVAFLTSYPCGTKKRKITKKELLRIREYVHDMWEFYSHYVTQEVNFLVPDNIAVAPEETVAMRTSPTNIGFYIASALCARDFGLITTKTMYNCIQNTVSTVEKLKKYKGHLYNWYDIKTLQVIGREYVSSVDSGNFCALVSATAEGILEYSPYFQNLVSLSERMKALCADADFSALYDSERDLFRLGYDATLGVYDKAHYDLYMSESRLTSYFAIARGEVPAKHWGMLGRPLVSDGLHIGLASWSGTAFEYFMPALLLPTYENSLCRESFINCIKAQTDKKYCGVWGCSESGYYAFDNDMNYQYKAFGTDKLAKCAGMEKEKVISPYSSFLCTEIALNIALKNLDKLKDLGMYGKYGFYEAADFTESRVGAGKGIVASYMAHHLGMSVLACDNAVFDGKMKDRFMRDPAMRSASVLLCEDIPADAPAKRKTSKEAATAKKKTAFEDRLTVITDNTRSETAMISNNKCKIIANNKGDIGMYFGKLNVNSVDFDGFATKRGLSASVENKGGDKADITSDISSFEFSSSFVRYRSESGVLTLAVLDGANAFEIITESTQEFSRSAICFEPILEEWKSYVAHPAYSGLFFESFYDEANDVLTFSGRQEGGKHISLSVVSVLNTIEGFCVSKQNVLAPRSTKTDMIEKCYDPDMKTGACIDPFCAVNTVPVKTDDGKYVCAFLVCVGNDKAQSEQTALYCKKLLSVGGLYSDLIFSSEKTARLVSGIRKSDFELLRRTVNSVAVPEANESSGNAELLWKYGISGDYPIFSVDLSCGTDTVASLLRIHRYLTAKGLFTNVVILYDETSVYGREVYDRLCKTAANAGSLRLIGHKYGIFFIDKTGAETDRLESIRALSNMCADTGRRERKELPAPVSVKPKTNEQSGIMRSYGGAFTEDGFICDKTAFSVFAHIISNPVFGTVLCENSLGYSFLFNSQMGVISKKDSDRLREEHGETLSVRINGIEYDMCASSDTVSYGFGDCVYSGNILGVAYRVTVNVAKKEFIKRITVEFLQNTDCDVILRVRAQMGNGMTKCMTGADTDRAYFASRSGFLGGYTGYVCAYRDGAIYKSTGDTVTAECKAARRMSFYIGVYAGKKHKEHLDRVCKGDTCEYLTPRDFLPKTQKYTGDVGLDLMYNKWLVYQTLESRLFARTGYYQCSGAYGFRDQLQDAVNICDIRPDICRTHIIRCAYHQFYEGDVLHWWHKTPSGTFGIRTKCSDDRLWLVWAVSEYIRITGDDSVLSVQVPYATSPLLFENEREKCVYIGHGSESESIFEHCKKALFISSDRGEHGLSLMGSCDWNDSYNMLDPGSESLWTSIFTVMVTELFLPQFEKYGDTETKLYFENFAGELRASIKKHGYEYGQYIRAYNADGTPMGSKTANECGCDVLVQSFAILSGIEEGKRAESILDAIEKMCDHENGIVKLISPPYGHDGDKRIGYVRDYPQGIRENGGQYTHAALWAIMALAKGGRTEKARALLAKICPADICKDVKRSAVYAGEPYVMAGDVVTSKGRYGKCGWTWYTGAAGWMRRATEYVYFDKNTPKTY